MYNFSKHFLEQIQLRNITMPEVEDVLLNPQQKEMEDELTVHQKIIYSNNRSYLIRVFVNELKHHLWQ